MNSVAGAAGAGGDTTRYAAQGNSEKRRMWAPLVFFLRVSVLGEFEAAGDTGDVSVDHDAFGDLEPRAEDYVSGLAGYAWKGEEVVHVERDLAAEVGDDFLRGADNGLRFVAEEA